MNRKGFKSEYNSLKMSEVVTRNQIKILKIFKTYLVRRKKVRKIFGHQACMKHFKNRHE